MTPLWSLDLAPPRNPSPLLERERERERQAATTIGEVAGNAVLMPGANPNSPETLTRQAEETREREFWRDGRSNANYGDSDGDGGYISEVKE